MTHLPLSLVVSIHDLSPVTGDTVSRMLGDLAEVGVERSSLLVIPDHHHRGRIDEDVRFAEWLRAEVEHGHEAVLHGYHHLRPTREEEGLVTRLITRSYTAGEGEFYDLPMDAATGLLQKGKDALKSCGLSPKGFIAPAWLLGPEAERAVAAEGFSYTTRIGMVIDCVEDRCFPSRSMVYSVRAQWRRLASLVWNEALFHALRHAPLLRISLHPPDWDHPAIRRHALACIRAAVREREVMTYGKWLDQWRASVHEGGSH